MTKAGQGQAWEVTRVRNLMLISTNKVQPSGYNFSVVLSPNDSNRLDLIATITPPPDQLKCDRRTAVKAVRRVVAGLGSQEIFVQQPELRVHDNQVEVVAFFDFTKFLDLLDQVRDREEFLIFGLITVEPYIRQLGGSPLTVSTRGLKDSLYRAADLEMASVATK